MTSEYNIDCNIIIITYLSLPCQYITLRTTHHVFYKKATIFCIIKTKKAIDNNFLLRIYLYYK